MSIWALVELNVRKELLPSPRDLLSNLDHHFTHIYDLTPLLWHQTFPPVSLDLDPTP